MTEEAENKEVSVERMEGDDRLFKKYYLKYRSRIYWYVYRKISRSGEAEDITAEVFMKLYEHLRNIKDRGDKGIAAWLYTVARNKSIDYLRKHSNRRVRSIDNEEIDIATSVFDDFVTDAMKDSDVKEVKDALVVVDAPGQEIMRLRFEEELKFNEIAKIVGKSEGACKMVFYRSLGRVRNEIKRTRQNEKK